ncbi:MAG: 8-amino-7-oxononanoate synthase [Desulfobulbaceae bacterium]|nr:MAG: 8-amino-7-oxononanoate synthase [Desulfobulbaceae bacterium]
MKISYLETLTQLRAAGRIRELRPLGEKKGCRVIYKGREMLNLTSNDYLGLAGDEELHRLFYRSMDEPKFLEKYGLGAASSRLLTGDSAHAHTLEQLLADSYGRSAALLYNSGYHANIGILPALCGKNDLILSDKLNHASIHDGLRLSQATHRRYRHCDYAHLYEILERYRQNYDRVAVVSESVFSMDGDVADLRRLVELKKKFDCLLYVDEAHAVGLYGRQGLGQAEEQGVLGDVDLLVGTFGKALASIGAFVLCTEEIREYLINLSRSLIFTTALPPVIVHWNEFVFQHMLELEHERRHLGWLADQLRGELRHYGLQTDGTTNIVPVLFGDAAETLALAEEMQKMGYLIFPVRPPAVPEGTSRFRLSLTATMQGHDLSGLAEQIAAAWKIMPDSRG